MGPRPADSPVAFATTVLANLSPLAGVWFLGWDTNQLAFVYTVEVLFAVLFAGVKALFATQPPNYDEIESDEQVLDDTGQKRPTGPSDLERKRGSVRVVEWLPPVYPRNVPFAVTWIEAALLFAALFPGFLARVVDPLGEIAGAATVSCAVSLVVSHVVATRQQYFGRRQYETVSPRGVATVPMQEAGVVFAVVAIAGVELNATGFLVVSVAVKTLVDCGQYREGGLSGWFTTPSADRSLRTVAVPDAPPTDAVRTDWRAVAVGGVFRGAERALGFAPLYLFVWIGILILSDGGPVYLGGVTLFAFVIAPLTVATLRAAEYTLNHGWLSYQRRDGTLVAYDELTDTPQWTAPVGEFRRAELSDDRLADRLFDSQSLTVTPTGVGGESGADDATDGELCLAHLRSADRAVSLFELPLATTAVEPFRSRYAAVVVALTVATVAVEVAFVFAPIGEERQLTAALLLPFVVPMTVFGFQRLWARAY